MLCVVVGWQQRAVYSWNTRDSCSPPHVHVVCYTKSPWTLWWKKGLGLAYFMSVFIEFRFPTVTNMWFSLSKMMHSHMIGDESNENHLPKDIFLIYHQFLITYGIKSRYLFCFRTKRKYLVIARSILMSLFTFWLVSIRCCK